MATRSTGTEIGAAARATRLRLLYQRAGMQVGAIFEAPRTPPALRAAARRTLERLAVSKPAARAAGNAKERGARLRALIGALTRLIDRIEDQQGGVRAVAGLRKLRTQAQALLAQEQPASSPKARALKPTAKKAAARSSTSGKLAKAKRKAAAKKKDGGRAPRVTKAAARKAPRKKQASIKKPAMKKAAAKRPAAKKPAVKTAAPRRTAAKKTAGTDTTAARPVKKNGGRQAPKKASAPAPAGRKKPSAKPSTTYAALGLGRGIESPAPSALEITGTPPTPSEPEPVLLGVSAPRAVKPGASFIARFAAYIKAAEAALEKKLTALGGGKVDVHLGIPPDESARWPVGTPVTVRVSGDGFAAQPAQSRFVWNGTENVVSFVINTAATLPEGSAILSFEAYIEGIRVAFVPIPIEIAAQPAAGEQNVKAGPARTAFASYASRDRDRVMDKLGALSAYDKGLKVFTDCLDMRPGETWKQRLEAEIPQSDLFLLFWSRAASASQWVSWEWHTALDRKGLAAIQPMPLEAPQVAPPPAELSSLHFNDIYLIVRDAELARQPPK